MVLYRRNHVAGGTYFFTVPLRNRRLSLLVDRIDDLRDSVRYVLQRKPFRIAAWVVFPDRLHAVWTLPPGDHDYSRRWKIINR
jgi:putative transposase